MNCIIQSTTPPHAFLAQLAQTICVVLLALFESTAVGDVLSYWRNDTGGTVSTNSIRISGTATRVELSPARTLLVDAASGQMCHIFHPGKALMRKPISEFTNASPCGANTNMAQPKDTGRSKRIGEHTAHEYTVLNPCGQHTFWIALDYPNWKQFQPESSKLQTNIPAGFGFPMPSGGLPGMVVRTESVVKMQPQPGATNGAAPVYVTNVSTLISAVIVPDDPSLMRVPDDYREVSDFHTVNSIEEANSALGAFKEAAALTNRPFSPGSLGSPPSEKGDYNSIRWKPSSTGSNPWSNAVAGGQSQLPNGGSQNEAEFIQVRSWGANGPETKLVRKADRTNEMNGTIQPGLTNRALRFGRVGTVNLRTNTLSGTNQLGLRFSATNLPVRVGD